MELQTIGISWFTFELRDRVMLSFAAPSLSVHATDHMCRQMLFRTFHLVWRTDAESNRAWIPFDGTEEVGCESACLALVSAIRGRRRNKHFQFERRNPQTARKAKVVAEQPLTFPAGRLSSIGTDSFFNASHAMAYIHPSGGNSDPADGKSEQERVSGWHACQRISCSKHRRTNFVVRGQYDQSVVVGANGFDTLER